MQDFAPVMGSFDSVIGLLEIEVLWIKENKVVGHLPCQRSALCIVHIRQPSGPSHA